MRVLHVIPSIAPRYGGPSTAVIGMNRALRAAGIDALVATTGADGPGELETRYDTIHDYERTRAIVFRRRWSESFKWSPALARWLGDHVREFDLVHVHAVFSHASIAAGSACRASGVPYLVRPLGTLDPWSLDHHRRRKQALMALAAGRLLKGASAMHYTSDDERSLAEARLPWLRRGVVVGLGIDDDCFLRTDEPASPRQNVVLSLGRLHPKKRIEAIIEAFHATAVDTRFADWRLVIAGDGDRDYLAALGRAAAAGRAASRISFVGWVSGRDRLDLLRTAKLFVAPSHQENFGLALIEALASATPVIVSPGVNLARDIDAAGAGWVCDAPRVSLSHLLRTALASEEALRTKGARARRYAERFRWPAVANALVKMYGDVLGESRRPLVGLDAAGSEAH